MMKIAVLAVGNQLRGRSDRGHRSRTGRGVIAPDDPATLRAKVTSKGGTTEAALAVMERAQIKAAIGKAARAANERAHELGEQLGRDG